MLFIYIYSCIFAPQNNNRGGYNVGDIDSQATVGSESEIYYMVMAYIM